MTSTSVAEESIQATPPVTNTLVSEPFVGAETDTSDDVVGFFVASGENIPEGYIPLGSLSEKDAAAYLSALEPALPGSAIS